ncbi:MAG: hypothetical protein JSW59_02225 [Phycisphaerales bacterium]|nr:MAG: hypothetical protein JSW59_02225 [Phycisphaerales bacterium]
MKVKLAFFAVLVVCLVLVMDSSLTAVDTRDIDLVIKKTVLDNQDLAIIDRFLDEAVQELVRERKFTDIARRRAVIISRKSEQGQYAEQFSKSAHKHIQEGFKQAEALRPEQRKTNAIINLLILINGLEDIRLMDLAVARLNDQNAVIRYWAVKCLTNPAIVQQLNASVESNPTQAVAIVGQLKPLVDTSSAETLTLMARFAAGLNIPQAEALLLQIADERIKRYADWTVKHELSEIALLKLLESKITVAASGSSQSVSRPAVARRFAQLYSHVIQRYLKGPVVLDDTHKNHLASVMVEVQEKCVSRLLGAPQTTFRRALERENMAAIADEHKALLGGDTTPGQLPSKLGFDYGTDSAGAKRTVPVPLPDAPRK